jgi:hypothetical protein
MGRDWALPWSLWRVLEIELVVFYKPVSMIAWFPLEDRHKSTLGAIMVTVKVLRASAASELLAHPNPELDR